MDVPGIAAAIAARYVAAVAIAPAGLAPIRSSSAHAPNALGGLPLVLVGPETGGLVGGNGTRIGVATWRARFYLALARDLARDTAELQSWLSVLLDVHKSASSLGGLVTMIRTTTWTVGLLPYAGKTYSGIELGLEVTTSEPWAVAA